MEQKPLVCRVCLQNEAESNYVSLYELIGSMQVYEHIMSIAEVRIAQEDGLPNSVCNLCFKLLQEAITFKEKCEKSDRLLKNATATKNEFIKVVHCMKKEETSTEVVTLYSKDVNSDSELDDTVQTDAMENLSENNPEQNVDVQICSDRVYKMVSEATKKNLSLQCDKCSQCFRSKCKLRVHWKREHVQKIFACDVCKKVCKSLRSFEKHKTLRSCIELKKNSEKVEVIRKENKRSFRCLVCDHVSHRYSDMAIHLVIHISGEKPYKCKLCPAAYTQIGTLNGHIAEKHDASLRPTCHVCGKTVASTRRLYHHMFKHKEATVPCPVCQRLFKTRKSMSIHTSRHSEDKNYECGECKKKFFTKSNLINHRKTAHLRAIVKCTKCDFKTKIEKTLAKHEVQHNGALLFSCSKCGKFYASTEQLEKHHRNAHKPKIYECPVCSTGYSRRSRMLNHIHKNHQDFEQAYNSNVANDSKLTHLKLSSKSQL